MKEDIIRLILTALLCAAAAPMFRQRAAASTMDVIIDTDAGSDDLMAIAFLLARDDVRIEAVTVCNGLAHVDRGARNIRRLLTLAGRTDVPVYAGRTTALKRSAEFPDEWRRVSDELPGVTLPAEAGSAPRIEAVDYLVKRLASPRNPARILALGPLTNLGEAVDADAAAFERVFMDRLLRP
jgi:purine nucleosidase